MLLLHIYSKYLSDLPPPDVDIHFISHTSYRMRTKGWLVLLLCPVEALRLETLSLFSRKKTSLASSLLEVNKDYETEGRPPWAGGGLLSDLANALIASPLFKVIKQGARNVIIDGAIDKGIQWNERRDEMARNQESLNRFYAEVEDKSTTYPSYYTQVINSLGFLLQ